MPAAGPDSGRNSRSGWPPTERTACANSSSADAFIRCTENASATPSMTDTTAAALRHRWLRNSCQEKPASNAKRVFMGGLIVRCHEGIGFAMDQLPPSDTRAADHLVLSTSVHTDPCAALKHVAFFLAVYGSPLISNVR
jgi:hypothetical protein